MHVTADRFCKPYTHHILPARCIDSHQPCESRGLCKSTLLFWPRSDHAVSQTEGIIQHLKPSLPGKKWLVAHNISFRSVQSRWISVLRKAHTCSTPSEVFSEFLYMMPILVWCTMDFSMAFQVSFIYMFLACLNVAQKTNFCWMTQFECKLKRLFSSSSTLLCLLKCTGDSAKTTENGLQTSYAP